MFTTRDEPSLSIPDNKTPAELGIDTSKGPDFDSVHNEINGEDLLNISKEVSGVIDNYIDERIITDIEADQLGYS